MNLVGRRVLVTGGARGLGAAFARGLVDAGARVVIADVLDEPGRALAAEIGAGYVSMDVSDLASIQAGVDASVARLGGLDGLINNAAITNSGGKGMDELDAALWDRVMAVNVRAVWQVAQAARAALAASGGGRIVNLASDTALWGAPKLLAYVASKGAVIAMTRSMARELADEGITVNAIAPGLVHTESTEYVPQARFDFYQHGRAVKREQQPADVVSAALFLLQESSGFVTGQVLPVNGGFVMH